MNLADLKLFKQIAQSGSMTRAAVQCGISQSAASQRVHEMESHLGVPVLDRSTRPVALTPAGKLYLEFARDVLRREEQFRMELGKLTHAVEGTVRVASIYSVGLSEMSRVRAHFAARYPEAQLAVDYMRPEQVYEAVRSGTADLGLVSYPEARRDFAVIPWRAEQMAVAARPGHPLAARAVLTPADLDGEDFVGFDEDLPIRRVQDRFFRERGIGVNLAMHFDNIQMIKEAVALGSGLSILPARTMQAEIEQGRLVAIPLDAPSLVRPVGIIHRRRRKFTHAVEAFLDMLRADTGS
ncbi:MAG TPA: LysR family transcriptional regulator [Bryobacteraceae bacterium]|nr:LysR family transcriptional regulator [Bryobacteraceae bacterium]